MARYFDAIRVGYNAMWLYLSMQENSCVGVLTRMEFKYPVLTIVIGAGKEGGRLVLDMAVKAKQEYETEVANDGLQS